MEGQGGGLLGGWCGAGADSEVRTQPTRPCTFFPAKATPMKTSFRDGLPAGFTEDFSPESPAGGKLITEPGCSLSSQWKSMFQLAWGLRGLRDGFMRMGLREVGTVPSRPQGLFSSSLPLFQHFLSSRARMACGTVVFPAFQCRLCPGRVGKGCASWRHNLTFRTHASKKLLTQSRLSCVALNTSRHPATGPRTAHTAPGVSGGRVS